MGEIRVTSSTTKKAEIEIHKHKLTTTTTTTATMKSSIAAILALGLCLSQGTLTKACGGANFLRDVGADAAALFGNHDLSDQISGSFSDNDRRKLFGIGDAAPIAIHLPFHKPDDFLGEFQTAAGEMYHTLRRTQHLLIQIIWIVLLRKKQMEILTQGSGSFWLASPSYSITPFADLARRRSRTVCQQEFVLEPTLLISLLCLLATVSCWELEMRPLLPFTSLFTNQMISLENFRRQRVRSFLTTSPTGTPLTSRCSQRSRTRQMQSIVLPWERTLCTAWNSVHKQSPSSLARQSLGSTWTVSRTTLCSRRSPKVWTQMILITRKILIRMTPLVQPSRLQVNTIITRIRASM